MPIAGFAKSFFANSRSAKEEGFILDLSSFRQCRLRYSSSKAKKLHGNGYACGFEKGALNFLFQWSLSSYSAVKLSLPF